MNGVRNMLAMFENENINNEFLTVQMEQLHNADTRDNCLATLERMNIYTEDYEPELLTEEQAAMVDLLDDLGMGIEAYEFAEECGKKCSGGGEGTEQEADDEEAIGESAKKVRNKVIGTMYDIGDGIDDVISKTPIGPVRDTIHSTINPVSFDQAKSNRKERDQWRKKKKSVWAKENEDPEMESMLARIPLGSVSETVNFFNATKDGITNKNIKMVNESINLVDSIIGINYTNENLNNVDEIFDDFGLESFDLMTNY